MNKILCCFILAVYFFSCSSSAQQQEQRSQNKVKGLLYTYPVVIDNKTYTFLLATGSSQSQINESIIKQHSHQDHGWQIDKAQSTVIIPEISLDGISIYKTEMTIADLSLFEQLFGFRVDGVLGWDMYNQFVWDIDNQHKTITIHRADNAQEDNDYKQCVYYSGDSLVFENTFVKDEKTLPFFLNTMNDSSSVDSETLKLVKLTKIKSLNSRDKVIENDGRGKVSEEHEQIKNYAMSNFQFENFTIASITFQLLPNEVHLNQLGTDFISRFDQFQLNPARSSLCFNHFDSRSNPLLHSIGIRAYNNHIELYNNDDDYLAKLGLKNGDIIVTVNQQSYVPEQITEVRNIIRYTKSLDLEINRDGKISHIQLTATDQP